MKIEKRVDKKWFYHYYRDSKTNNTILHGLFNSYFDYYIVYRYHNELKGFCLTKKRWL